MRLKYYTIWQGELMNRRALSLATLFLLFACPGAFAGYNEGIAALNSGDNIRAYNEFKYAAEEGDVKAQNRLGVMNDLGQGIPQNYTEAVKWYLKAAEQGFADAQYNLGMMYLIGKGVTPNPAEAIKWLRYAADQGHVWAQNTMGYLNATGQGMPQNFTEAEKWYRMAAEQGFASAQCNLGVMYYKGQGVPQDYVQAHMWFNLAATGGHADAQKWREEVSRKMSPAQLTEAQRLASDWFLRKK